MTDAQYHRRAALLTLLVLALLAKVLTGCGEGRQPPAPPAQAAVEANAGMQALAIFLGPARTQAVEDIIAGAAAFARATAGAAELPAATWTQERIIADPAGYREAGEQAEADARGGAWKAWAWAAALTLAPIAFSVLRNVPGFGPAAAAIAEGVWRAFATRRQKDADAKQAVLAAGTTQALALLRAALPPETVEAYLARLPADVRAAAEAAGIAVPQPEAKA